MAPSTGIIVAWSPASLQPVLMGLSYLPTVFALVFLATRDDNDHYKDKKGFTGGVAGAVSLGYGLIHSIIVSSTRSEDLCQVLMLLRGIIGFLAFIGFLAIAVVGAGDALGFIFLWLVWSLSALPEAFMLYTYSAALRAEKLGLPVEPQHAPPAPPPSGGHLVMGHGGGFGLPPSWGGPQPPPQPMQVPLQQPTSGDDFGLGGCQTQPAHLMVNIGMAPAAHTSCPPPHKQDFGLGGPRMGGQGVGSIVVVTSAAPASGGGGDFGISGGAVPMASAHVVGVDRNRDGIPDALQGGYVGGAPIDVSPAPQLGAYGSPQAPGAGGAADGGTPYF